MPYLLKRLKWRWKVYSGTETNWSTGLGQSAGKTIFWSRPSTFFLALKVGLQLIVLMSACVMVSAVWSVSCLLFFYSRSLTVTSRARPFLKVGARAPVPYGDVYQNSICSTISDQERPVTVPGSIASGGVRR